MTKTPVIQVRNLHKVYRIGSQKLHALAGVDLDIFQGEFCAILGTSGSGKSTFLNLLAGLEPASKGTIKIGSFMLAKKSEQELVDFRRDNIGFVFQSFNLIPTLNAWENVALPLMFKQMPKAERKKKAVAILKQMGLAKHQQHKPNQLSGGQQQRVSIARSLVVQPKIIFADEPTGNLDSHTGAEILELMRKLVTEQGQTLVMVTHDEKQAQLADRIIRISDGKIIAIEEVSHA